MNWTITRLDKNLYKLVDGKISMEVRLDSNIEGDPEILFTTSRDMSPDGVILMPQLYPIPEDDYEPIIGNIYVYKDNKCIESSLVSVKIEKSTIALPIAKKYIESYFLD